MAVPTTTVWIDFNNNGTFAAGDEVSSDVISAEWTRGRNADFSGDAQGAATIVLKNWTGTYNTNLLPGLPVHIRSNYSATDRAHFYGFIQRAAPNAWERTVTVTCYDPLKKYADDSASTALVAGGIQYSAREHRIRLLEAYERGALNYVMNPGFETDTTGWATSAGTLTRVTTQHYEGAASGQFAAGAASRSVYYDAKVVPLFEQQAWHAAVYLKCASGTQTWTLSFINQSDSQTEAKSVTVTTTWTRFDIGIDLDTNGLASLGGLRLMLTSTANDTVFIDAATITRGGELYPFTATAGRWPNLIQNGSFDGNYLRGWTPAWQNFIGNPSFETNTSGWSAAGDAFTAASTLSRQTSQHKFGVASGRVTGGGVGAGAFNAITGTFASSIAVYVGMWLYTTGGTTDVVVGIGSQGTPADVATTTGSQTGSTWTFYDFVWFPSGSRTDAHLFVKWGAGGTGNDIYFDGAFVIKSFFDVTNEWQSTWTNGPYTYADTGPVGGGVAATSFTTSTTTPKYGSRCLHVVTPATSLAGVFYDFFWDTVAWMKGVQYVVSVWLNCTSGTFPFKVGLSLNNGDGTYDEASTTGTATAGTWTQATFTITPTVDHVPGQIITDQPAGSIAEAMLSIIQTNATARTFKVDGIRIIPGSAADDFEMSHWNIPTTEADIFDIGASFSGSVLGSLETINTLVLSTHWIEAEMTAPYYSYHVDDRATLAAKASSETLTNTFSGFTESDTDRDSIVNVVKVSYVDGNRVYSDETSVGTYGPTSMYEIDGSEYFPDATIPEIVGPSLIDRYGAPRGRPTMELVKGPPDSFTSVVTRDIDDMITVTLTRLGISSVTYLIVSMKISVTDGMKIWHASWQLETYP